MHKFLFRETINENKQFRQKKPMYIRMKEGGL